MDIGLYCNLSDTTALIKFYVFTDGVTDCSVTGSKSKGILAAAQACQSTIPLLSPTMTPSNSFHFNASTSILDTQIDALKASSPKPLSIEPRYGTSSKPLSIEPHYGTSSKPLSIETHFSSSPKPLSGKVFLMIKNGPGFMV